MRRPLWLLLPTLLVAAFAAFTRPASRVSLDAVVSSVRVKTDTVNVVFQCEGTRSVDPWVVTLTSPSDSVIWVLDPSSDVDSIEIVPKRRMVLLRPWPFEQGNRRGMKGRPAVQTDARGNKGDRYQYEVTAMCPGPGNSWRKAVIDPDVIIDF